VNEEEELDRAVGSARKERTKPPIVGIGASAGGVKALQEFFAHVPEKIGAAFVVIVHLDPASRSELAEILSIHTKMKVTQVQTTNDLERDQIYVIPPDRRLSISDHEVSAVPFDAPRGHRSPIDLFFRSLAEQHGDGFAVILTGAGSDGAVGVKAIKEAGGIVIVQDPNEAEYPSMPRAAIATEVADFVLRVGQMGQQLAELIRTRGQVYDTLRDDEEEYLRRILAHVRVRTGHDFSHYKRSTVLRRIVRRTQVTRTESLGQYYQYLRENVEEAQALLADLLISVTTFFRDPKAFELLAKRVVPKLVESKDADAVIRVWIPGCATGEEAYTISMLLLEQAAKQEFRPELQVFASDMDTGALSIAREGRYPEAIETDVSEERLRRFFAREGDHYRVKRELRDVVLFAHHSLLKDPPFSKLDLVSCRNLLIYLDRDLQAQVLNTLHYALNPDGYLMLGSSESAEHPNNLFRPIDRDSRIYQSVLGSGDRVSGLPHLVRVPAGDRMPLTRDRGRAAAPSDALLHRQALEKIAPPSILVDESHRAVHLSETAGRYLQPAGGPLTGDVADLVRQELRFDLRSGLHRAFERGETTLSPPIPVKFNGVAHRTYFQVRPVSVSPGEMSARHALVVFIEGEPVEPSKADLTAAPEEGRAALETIRRLEQELQLSESRLRTTREESEAANEELRAANEELQSINEEYRSTSEELETSKEELQSINEELQTVNSELKLKLESISRAHSDLQNLMAATDFGTLFLDTALRIKRFTPRLTDIFNITSSDEGRPITDFTHKLEYDHLPEDAKVVLRELSPIEREVKSRNGGWYLVRMRPYRTVDDKIDGVVATFVDMTERRRMEDALRSSEARLRHETRLVEVSRAPIFVWDLDGGIIDWNRGSEQLYGFNKKEAVGHQKNVFLKTHVPGSSWDALVKELTKRGAWNGELQEVTKDGRTILVESQIELVPMDGRRLVLESTRDITERKAWDRRQELLLSELAHRVKNTLAVVQSIAGQTLRSAPSNEEFVERFNGRIDALARAHGLLLESHWSGTDIGLLVRGQLEPYIAEGPDRIRISGPAVTLRADQAIPFGLVLHELATNAAKYGSLSVTGGHVELNWSLAERNHRRILTVVWQERDGPPVKEPKGKGFGSRLIAKGLPGAKVQHEYRKDGVVSTIEIPLPDEKADE